MSKRKRPSAHKAPSTDDARAPGDAPAPPPTLEQALAAYRLGNWPEAERLCRAILARQPDDFDPLYLQGMIAAQTGRLQEGADLLARAIGVNPGHAEAAYNRGIMLSDLGRHEAALASYSSAIALKPDYVQAHNSRGNALLGLNRPAEALESFVQALALAPNHPEACNNQGIALFHLKRFAEALKSFERAIAIAPNYADAYYNLGNALRDLDRHEDALASYEKALAIRPDHAEACNNRGVALAELKRYEAALESYERALRLKPNYGEAHYNHGSALHELKRPEQAIAAYRLALEHGADAERIDYALAALGAAPLPAAAPAQFVARLFDRYADRFDQDLVGTLNYQTPTLLADQFKRFCPSRNLDILDLGCGTGLLGPLLKPSARTLTGVDLSGNMLEKAREREVYDDLIKAEVTAFLEGRPQSYDLAVAADVFVYIGDLAAVFAGARHALRPGGWLSFSIEASDGEPIVLKPARRYAHSIAYVEKLAREHGFAVTNIEARVIRKEGGSDVNGYVALLRRT